MESSVDIDLILLLNVADELSYSANEDHFLRHVSVAVRSNSSALAVTAAVDGFVSKENPCRSVNLSSPQFCAPFKEDPFVLLPDYAELCKQVSTSGDHVGIPCALVLSAVCDCKIQLYCPSLNLSFTADRRCCCRWLH